MRMHKAWLGLVFLGLAQPAYAQQPGVIHRLTIATASPYVSDKQVDDIIKEMNTTLRGKSPRYSWDVDCPGVEFLRVGPVIHNPELADSGTFNELRNSLRQHEPSANVMVVTGINCSFVIGAAGCSPVGSEPLVVGTYPGYDAELWLHERGHGMGLEHSREGPKPDTEVPQGVGMRFMFWQLGLGHTGKTQDECDHFHRRPFASTVAQLAAAVPPGSPTVAPADADPSEDVRQAAQAAGLTVKAFQVVGPPWLHGQLPMTQIASLEAGDVNSIREMLRGGVTVYTAQASQVLAFRGTAEDVDLIRQSLEDQLPAVGPGSQVDGIAAQNLLRAKLNAPVALGILLNRTKSTDALAVLASARRLQNAIAFADPAHAPALRAAALQGLALSNSPEADKELDSALQEALDPAALPAATIVAALGGNPTSGLGMTNPNNKPIAISPDEVGRLTETRRRVQFGGLESLFGRSVP